MSKWQKVLLCWSVVVLGGAEWIKHIHLSDRTEILVGAVEIVAAVLTGVAFGIATISKKREG
jgi:hypothetical protein